MTDSKQISPTPSPKPDRTPWVKEIGAIIFLIIGVVGFLDASYLYMEHLRGTVPYCTIVSGCSKVLLSDYASIGPVPLSLLGVAYYAIIIAGTLLFFDLRQIRILHILAAYTLVGILASGYFVYLQFFVIKALCIYCLFSALTSTSLFATGAVIYKKTAPAKNFD